MTTKKVAFGARPKPVAAAIDPDAVDAFVAGGAEQPNNSKPAESDAEAAPEKLKFKRLTIDVDASLHKRLKARTAEEDTTIADVARQLLTDWVYRK